MLDSTFELICLAASNSLMVFCFCNLIIAIIVVGSSKPSSQFNEEKPKVVPSIVNDDSFNKVSVSLCEKISTLVEAGEASSVSITMVENEGGSPDEEEEEEEEDDDDDDDDLKRRVEEFIEKINNGWRAEKVKTYSLGQ